MLSFARASLLVLGFTSFVGAAHGEKIVLVDRDPPLTKDLRIAKTSLKEVSPLLIHVASAEFSAFTHPHYPGSSLRIQKSDFCDPTVNVYTGFLDVDYGRKHMFFYFFESRRNPETDDVMMWINGGPGGSSSMSMLMANGPCNIDIRGTRSNGTVWNRYSWNNEANIFFLDQPAGVGFSYSETGHTVGSTKVAAKDVAQFIDIFFDTFKQFEGRPLHLAGESYGGIYLPVFASEVWDMNAVAKVEGRHTINLVSVVIGNGVADVSTIFPGRFEAECGRGATDRPVRDIASCIEMRKALPICQKKLQNSCFDLLDKMECRAAAQFCDEYFMHFWDVSWNPYDVTKPCLGDNLCYLEIPAIETYLNSTRIRKAIGTTLDQFPYEYKIRSEAVGMAFDEQLDRLSTPSHLYVAELLSRGIRFLIYAGTYDSACGWVSNKMWVEKLDWSGRNMLETQAWRTWNVSGNPVGEVKNVGMLTIASVWAAGHIAAHDKPAEVHNMISRWLNELDF